MTGRKCIDVMLAAKLLLKVIYRFITNINLDIYLIDPSKVLDIHSDVGDKNVRMELGGERADFMKSLFRSKLCLLRLNIYCTWYGRGRGSDGSQ